MSFKDHFSKQSKSYLEFRPSYPKELFSFIAYFLPNDKKEKKVALDIATGNGQAAISLCDFLHNFLPNFSHEVFAIDASQNQIEHAMLHPQIRYLISKAEETGFPDNFFDLITVAQAFHWFDFEKFFTEISRIAKANSILAIWGYTNSFIEDEIDNIVNHFYKNIVGPYWPKERKYVEEKYASIKIPFEKIAEKEFTAMKKTTLKNFIGYLNSWSATQKYLEENNQENPSLSLEKKLKPLWKGYKMVHWPIFLKIYRIN